jgi:cystathionine beta-synthase
MENSSRDHILSSIYEAVGHTPMVRMNKVPKDEGIECEVLAKCEFMNPGGSVKDRIGVEMFLAAEKEGRIKPGDTIIEATSGNAGIGLAFMAACKGYKMVITLPEKMSNEKVSVLSALGAEIIRTPTEAHTFDENSHYMVARKILKERENAHILDQYANPNNPGAHFRHTGQEIYDQCEGKVDYVFMGVGTGGTISGVARKLKELNPNIKIVGIDPYGSILAQPAELNTNEKSYHVEGIGYDFIPDSLDRSVVDAWVKTDDPESLRLARDLIRKEGFLCGSSSGSVMEGAIKFLRQNGLDKRTDLRCVLLLPDSIRNYLSKFCSDEWMVKKGFLEPSHLVLKNHPLYGKTISALELKKIPHYDDRLTISDCLDSFAKGELAVPLIQDGKVKGIVTRQSILNGMMKKGLTNYHSASNAITKEAVIVNHTTDLSVIDTLLKNEEVVFVQKLSDKGKIAELYGVTKLDLIKLVRRETKELI